MGWHGGGARQRGRKTSRGRQRCAVGRTAPWPSVALACFLRVEISATARRTEQAMGPGPIGAGRCGRSTPKAPRWFAGASWPIRGRHRRSRGRVQWRMAPGGPRRALDGQTPIIGHAAQAVVGLRAAGGPVPTHTCLSNGRLAAAEVGRERARRLRIEYTRRRRDFLAVRQSAWGPSTPFGSARACGAVLRHEHAQRVRTPGRQQMSLLGETRSDHLATLLICRAEISLRRFCPVRSSGQCG